jgi:hypothetical protein
MANCLDVPIPLEQLTDKDFCSADCLLKFARKEK